MMPSYGMYVFSDEKSFAFHSTLLWEISYLNQEKYALKTRLFPSQIVRRENGNFLKKITDRKIAFIAFFS